MPFGKDMADISGIWSTIQRDMWQDTGLNGDAQCIEQLGWMLFFKIFSDKDQELELMDDNYKSPIPPELHWDKWAGDDEGMTVKSFRSLLTVRFSRPCKYSCC